LCAGIAALTLAQTPAAFADDDEGPVAVTVSFGAGLNTAQPGNSANHHILPGGIHVRTGGVVNFNVAGFHQIFVYNPGKGPDDVVPNVDPMALFNNDLTGLYYQGLSPAPPTTNPSNAVNRIESVSFSAPGRYLVICNVAPHFRDGMWAWIIVTGNGHDH
jgi:hypothetical protein